MSTEVEFGRVVLLTCFPSLLAIVNSDVLKLQLCGIVAK